MAFQPFILGASVLTLDAGTYEGQISGAVFTPSASITNWTAINSDTHAFTSPATWVLDLTYAQDFQDAASLALYLHENEGTVVSAVFTPIEGGSTVTANVSITPGAIGAGDTTSVASSTVSLGSTKPVIAPVVIP
jgi:hypothetical protein